MDYLKLAEQAVNYVRDACGILANNREADLQKVKTLGDSFSKMRKVVGATQTEASRLDSQDQIAIRSESCRAFKVGNCEDMARVAFCWLAANHVRPLELAYFTPSNSSASRPVRPAGMPDTIEFEGPDHMFVILGREQNALDDKGSMGICDYSFWNEDAVICDPWAKRWYKKARLGLESKALARFTGGSTDLSVEYRLDKGEAWSPVSFKLIV
ncbi:MAG TPA: hypothetical protein VKE74_19745 [Gemmataceae bacterium]|nr:hypothetical protein [Gemmataceae bacterium]